MEETSSANEGVIKTLVSRGWRFRDLEILHSLIRTLHPPPAAAAVDSVESELLNMDICSFGASSLPDSTVLKRSSYLQGPKILQVVSVRDICLSCTDAPLRDSQFHHRLLRLVLTDGCSVVTSVEYTPIPSVSEDKLVPGTKVRLENKIPVHSGILCLNTRILSVLGGQVQSLFDEWQISQKYSGFSRSSLRLSQSDSGIGPPPFERLRIGESQLHYSHDDRENLAGDLKVERLSHNLQGVSLPKKVEEKPSTSNVRPKEVSEAVLVQNQAAAQKLLQKMTQQPAHEGSHSRGHRHRMKGKQDEAEVFTLEEWEKRKSSNPNTIFTSQNQGVANDEELARRLQKQFDLEDCHVATHLTDAERIRMSMFSFGESRDQRNDNASEYRGRVRGRGRGRKRFT